MVGVREQVPAFVSLGTCPGLVVIIGRAPAFNFLGAHIPCLVVGAVPILGRSRVSCGVVVSLKMSALERCQKLLRTVVKITPWERSPKGSIAKRRNIRENGSSI